jgi:phosphopantothenoylcysteine decarboxylase/phosphopantothenate--cysteine ligase
MNLAGKKILLGITGGIAAYKTPILVRRLRQAGADVRVVLTRAAEEFVTATALAAVSASPPRTALFDVQAEAAMGHIELARWADCVIIAPATANCLAQLAQGAAQDLLTTLCLATRAPIVVVPAMNNVMWESPPVQSNLDRLLGFGHGVMPPDTGEQACGETGPGRMPEPEAIVEFLQRYLAGLQPIRSSLLEGLRILITAGPTREAIDPVRFISNHSSGKQGYAFAQAALELGARVTLVTGPTTLTPPPGARTIDVTSAREMLDAVNAELPGTDMFIGVAAVADYRPRDVYDHKIKRVEQGIDAIALVPNPDIIASVAASIDRPRLVVGFAAETQDALPNARAKLQRKNLDAIIVNDVSDKRIGFNSDDNAATLVTTTGEVFFSARPKRALAHDLLLNLHELMNRGLAPTNPQPP